MMKLHQIVSLLTIQMLGLLYQLKMKRAAQETPPAPVDEEIIEL